ERVVGNDFVLDIRLEYDASEAMASDALDASVNYAEVVEIARRVMSEPSRLLEHAAGRLRDALLAAMPCITAGRIRLAKVKPPISARLACCSFTVEW
ncbi:MAG: dihydroneopterin aldolase, partial [Muribaculaceae bacterium]|nr:dihydroneopterin aldolase [Muribaculaceae bacterium]